MQAAFKQNIENVVKPMLRDVHRASHERKESIINAITGFITDIVSYENSMEVSQKLKLMKLGELEPLLEYNALKEHLLMLKTEVVEDRNSKRVLMSKASKSWICGRKHKIVHYRGGCKRVRAGTAHDPISAAQHVMDPSAAKKPVLD